MARRLSPPLLAAVSNLNNENTYHYFWPADNGIWASGGRKQVAAAAAAAAAAGNGWWRQGRTTKAAAVGGEWSYLAVYGVCSVLFVLCCVRVSGVGKCFF